MVEKEIDLKTLIDEEYIKKLQDVFWKLFGFSFYIVDVNDRAIIGFDKLHTLCSLVKSTEKGRELCEISDSSILEDVKISSKMICRKCMAVGLTDVAMPIIVQKKHVATIFSGQVNAHGLTAENVRKFAREIGVDENEMVKAYNKMPFVESNYFEPILELMKLLSDNIADIIEANIERNDFEAANKKSNNVIHREYNMQIFMNDMYKKMFMESEYDENILKDVIKDIKEFLDFEEVSIYRDISGNNTEFAPVAGDIENAKVIDEDALSVIYSIEKYGFVCYDKSQALAKYITNGDYITVSIPIFVDKQFTGFINMSTNNKKRIFTVSEINLFKNIANFAGDFYYRIIADKKLKEAGIIKKHILE